MPGVLPSAVQCTSRPPTGKIRGPTWRSAGCESLPLKAVAQPPPPPHLPSWRETLLEIHRGPDPAHLKMLPGTHCPENKPEGESADGPTSTPGSPHRSTGLPATRTLPPVLSWPLPTQKATWPTLLFQVIPSRLPLPPSLGRVPLLCASAPPSTSW